MNILFLTVLVAIIAVAFMVLGLSITQIRKGRDLQSEVGENDEMKKRGLKCASQEMREEEALLRGESPEGLPGCGGKTCGDCTSHCDISEESTSHS